MPANSNAAANTGSTLAYNTGVNKTSTAISTNIIIYVNNTAVGAVQELSIQGQDHLKWLMKLEQMVILILCQLRLQIFLVLVKELDLIV